MDIQPTTQSISDDQELAKVLAGVSQQADEALQFEETPVISIPTPEPVTPAEPTLPSPAASTPVGYNPPASPSTSTTSDLDSIKKDALQELRPLVDKLDLGPEEKFDTYLLLLRSTDDKSLIAPAHVAAQAIADETRRAQALLDIIKEIDYLSAPATTN
jgi:hypothetical protein